MRIGLLTDGGYPYATGESRLWCDRLVRGLPQHEFDLFALSRSAHQEDQGWVRLPHHVSRVRTAPLWTPEDGTLRGSGERGLLARLVTGGGVSFGRRDRRRFAHHLTALATAICATEDAGPDPATGEGPGAELFTEGLYGLAELARERGGLHLALRSETTVRILEAASRARGTGRTVQSATVVDHLAFAAELERVLRPLSLDWYDQESLGAVDLCHAASGGAAALPGLLAKRFFGVPLLVTEHGVQLRTHYLSAPDAPFGAPVRALLANFHAQLAAEVYRQAAIVTAGNTHVRRWQQRCGADPAEQRTVYPGMAAERFSPVGEDDDAGGPDTLVWVGRIEPAKDLIALLHAFAEVRRAEPDARLRIFGAPAESDEATTYLAHCRALAAQLFPDEATGAHAEGVSPVSFEEIGGPEVPDLAEAYAAGGVIVLSSVVEGFPISLASRCSAAGPPSRPTANSPAAAHWRSSARECAPCSWPPSSSSSAPCCPCCSWPISASAARGRRSPPPPSGSCSSWPGCSPRTDCPNRAPSRSPPPAPWRPPPPPSSSPDGCPASNRWPGPCTPSSRRAAPDPYLPSPVARRPWGSCSTPPPPSPGPPPTPTPTPGPSRPHRRTTHHRTTAQLPRSRRRGPCPTPHELTDRPRSNPP
ncbi:hypothetical protein SMICM304S_10653 [Streptomyces microflavus]